MALLYTLEEAAGILGISPGELRAKAQAREVPAILCSGTWKLRSTVVNDLARQRGAPVRPSEPAPRAQPSEAGGRPAPTAPAARPEAPAVRVPEPEPPAPQAVPAPDLRLKAAPDLAPPVSTVAAAVVASKTRPELPPPVVVAPAASDRPAPEVRAESAFPVHLDPDAFERLVQLPPGALARSLPADGSVRETEHHGPAPADAAPHLIDFSAFDLPAFADAPHSAGDSETSAVEADPPEAMDEPAELPELPAEKEPSPPRVMTCPNLACRSPGLVPTSRLNRPMRCKVCGTDFYWDAASDAFVIGLHHEAVSTSGAQARPASSAPTTTITTPYRYRRWTRQRVLRWARAGALVVLLGGAAFAAIARLSVKPELPNQVQDRALFIGKALCRDDPSSIQAVVEPGTWSDAQAWFKEVRPTNWPASDAGAVIEPRIKFARVKSGVGECDLHIWPAVGEGGVALGTAWVWSGERWQLDGTKTLKFKSMPLAARKPPVGPSPGGPPGSRPSGKRGGPAAPVPPRVDDTP
ncbi:MAG: hypothetical protein P4L84_19820 [Isosphaeraceae bacterium]|nr:hypothetical protein [Isosphaeraceae bacterium]